MPVNADPITDKQVRSVLGSVGHLYLGPLHPYDIEPKAIKLIHKAKKVISLDVQGYVRSIENHRVRLSVSEKLDDALLCAHIIKADKTELDAILKFYKMEESELMYAYKIYEMVITKGSDGGFVRRLNGEKVHYDAKRIREVHDTTGAGDVFFAVYLINRLHRGKDIPTSSKLAASLAAKQITGHYISPETLSLEL